MTSDTRPSRFFLPCYIEKLGPAHEASIHLNLMISIPVHVPVLCPHTAAQSYDIVLVTFTTVTICDSGDVALCHKQ